MFSLLSSKALWIGIAVAAGISILFFYSHFLYKSGETKVVAAQAIAQVKQDTKIRNTYENIDKQTPDGADRNAAVNWLLSYTSDR